jgi:hypothetical protein
MFCVLYFQPVILSNLPKVLNLLDGTEAQKTIVEETLLKAVSVQGAKPPPVLAGPSSVVAATAASSNAKGESAQAPIVAPSELLMALHNLEEAVGLKRCADGILHFLPIIVM